MATLEDIVAASKILSEDPESVMGGSVSKPKENQDRASDVRNEDDVSAADAVISKRDMEIETVVESTFDEEKGKFGVKNFRTVPYSSSSIGVNGVDVGLDADDSQEGLVSGRENENFEDSLTDNGEGGSMGYMDVDGHADGEEGIDEKLKDHENVFQVGDFVWGKIRSHPWWPGQVYDPEDASEFAMKRKQEGRLLVAFFGDGTCSWCLPSQLIPFVENFSEMSTGSSSKSFLNAVERAIDEVGRLVELERTCKCISKEKRDGLARPVVENAGLKAGVVIPDIDVGRLSIPKFEPKEVLDEVMQLAKSVSIDSALDLAIIRSWLSAFYYYKGGYQMPVYHGLLHIEGLEDKNKNVNEVGNDFSVPIEVPILGPQEDDWLLSPAVGSVEPPDLAENKVPHKRKQKSVAELMGENKNVKPESRKRGSAKQGVDFEKSLPSQKKKNDGDVGSEGASSTGKKGRKKKVEEVSESPKITNVKDSSAEISSRGADGVNGGPLLRKPKEIEVAGAETVSGEAIEEMEIVSSPRERKKSKYLSPPYTNLAWRMGNSSSRTEPFEHDKTTRITQVEERQKEATEDISTSQPIPKPVDNVSEGKLPNGQLESLNVPEDKSPLTVKNDKKLSFLVSDVDAPVNELLSDIELASLDPFYLTNKGSLEKVSGFVSAFRSSTNFQGENYKTYGKGKGKAVRKRKSQHSQLGNENSETKAKSPKASTEKKLNTSNSKKAAETSVGKSTMDTAEGTTSSCLILQFVTGFPLPSKKDIIKLFGKFGSLNKMETKVETESHSIRVLYVNDSDAEAAFKSSLDQNPFGSENVTYRLLRSSAGTKTRRSHPNITLPLKRAPETREASRPTYDLVSDFNTIRQKLEITTAIVENYHSKFSAEDISSLKDDMKHLMEEVETVSEKVRVMAEKASS